MDQILVNLLTQALARAKEDPTPAPIQPAPMNDTSPGGFTANPQPAPVPDTASNPDGSRKYVTADMLYGLMATTGPWAWKQYTNLTSAQIAEMRNSGYGAVQYPGPKYLNF
jgi:hypothetical protein